MPGSVPGVGDITARRSAHTAPVPKVTVLIKKHPNKKLSGSRPCTTAAGARGDKDSAAREARETGSRERWHLRRNLKAHWAPAEPGAEPRGCHTRRKA